MQSTEEQRKFLGHQVKVKLSNKEDGSVAHGMLLTISDDGEVCLLEEAGNKLWCWPALEISALNG